jgi:Domain of unknown function (DUF397)
MSAWGPWFKSAASLSNGNCVETRWRKSSHSMSNGQCVEWRKSSRSSHAGNCVEIAEDGPLVQVRDSKNPGGGILAFGAEAWAAFTAAIKAGEFPAP